MITTPTDAYGRQILTVGQLRTMLEGHDEHTHVVLATPDWYVNVEAVAAPDLNPTDPDDSGDWACVTLFPGSDFDSRQM